MSILPGSTIGILGGGQLGRMSAMAAREMGYRVRALDPDREPAARFLVDEHVCAAFDDDDAMVSLASRVDVMTLEIEKLSVSGLARIAERTPCRPAGPVLEVIQDRARQKHFLQKHRLPLGEFRVARGEAEIASAVQELGGRTFVKLARGGYDGRGQFQTERVEDAGPAAAALGPQAVVVERALAIEQEISVLCARSPSGDIAIYPPALNHHEARILAWSVLPAPIPPALATRASEIARTIAQALEVEGLLCIELFVVGGELLVNELAPRPHNSYHASVVGSATSQFEQHVRAICDLPLGSVDSLRPAAIVNLLGDLWVDGQTPAFDRALRLPGVRVHLYGKSGAKPGRKMGHLSATAPTAQAAVVLVQQALKTLTGC